MLQLLVVGARQHLSGAAPPEVAGNTSVSCHEADAVALNRYLLDINNNNNNHHHHHRVTQSSHSINAIGPAPLLTLM
jgi:hypothetical protein